MNKFKKTAISLLFLVALPAFAQNKPVVQFIATGGTIAMKIDPVSYTHLTLPTTPYV